MLFNTKKIKFINMSDVDSFHIDFDWKISLSDILTSAENNNLDLRDEEVLTEYLKTVGFDTTKPFHITESFSHRNLHNKIVDQPFIEGFADEEYMLANGIWSAEVAQRKYHKYKGMLDDIRSLQSQGNSLHSETATLVHSLFEERQAKEKGKNRTVYIKKNKGESSEFLDKDMDEFLENEEKMLSKEGMVNKGEGNE